MYIYICTYFSVSCTVIYVQRLVRGISYVYKTNPAQASYCEFVHKHVNLCEFVSNVYFVSGHVNLCEFVVTLVTNQLLNCILLDDKNKNKMLHWFLSFMASVFVLFMLLYVAEIDSHR